jgi:hemoglobin/transferrin/lactoferrin receptor protein
VAVRGTRLLAIADTAGNFWLPAVPPGPQHLAASFVGYRTAEQALQVPAGGRVPCDLALEVGALPLDPVLVTARGRPSRLRELGGSAGVVEAAELAQANPVSISDALGRCPGAAAQADMPWGAQVQLRGLSRDHVVLLIDGNRISTTTDVAAQFGLVPPMDVEQLEILKGPVSVLYGSGATGGVVNAIPFSGRFAPRPQWRAAAATSYESAARGLSAYARAGLDAPAHYLMVSQALRDFASYRDGSGARVPNSQFADHQTHLNAGWRAGAHALALRYQWFEAREVGIPGAGGVFPSAATVTYPRTGRWLAELSWKRRSSSRWGGSELKIFAQTVERRAEVLPNAVSLLPGPPLRRVRPQWIAPAADHRTLGLRWNQMLALGGHQLVAGAEAWQKELRSVRRRLTLVEVLGPDSAVVRAVESLGEDRSLPRSTYAPLGLYAEDEFRLSSRLTLNSGARLDLIRVRSQRTFKSYLPPTDEVLWEAQGNLDWSWSAQARASYVLSPRWDAHLNLARSFRSPGLEERYLYVDLGDVVVVGDPDLDSERGFFAEAGLQARSGFLSWKGQVFYNRIAGMVIEVPATYEDRPARRKANAGLAVLAGGESQLVLAPHPRLLAEAQVSYVRGRDARQRQPLPAMAPLRGRLSLQWGRSQGLLGRAALDLVARQGQVAPGELPTGGHAALELGGEWGGLRTGGFRHRLALGLRNALDAGYRDHLTRSRGFELKAPGRSFFFNWSAEQ